LTVVDTTVLVAITVYQTIVKNTLPVSSNNLPVFGQTAFLSSDSMSEITNKLTNTFYSVYSVKSPIE